MESKDLALSLISGAVCAATTFFAYQRYQKYSESNFKYTDIVEEPFRDLNYAE